MYKQLILWFLKEQNGAFFVILISHLFPNSHESGTILSWKLMLSFPNDLP